MFKNGKILVATDFTERSNEAVANADRWAVATNSSLVVCHVVPDWIHNNMLFPQEFQQELIHLVEAERLAEQAAYEQVTSVTGRASDAFDIAVDSGAPDAGIVNRAEEAEATLLVVGAGKGKDGFKRALIGRVSERVVRYAHCSVLVARPGLGSGRILVGTDFSAPSSLAVEAAAEVAQLFGWRTTLLHCLGVGSSPLVSLGVPLGASPVAIRPDILDTVSENAKTLMQSLSSQFSLQAELRVEKGGADEHIVQVAEEIRADLIVLGTAGRTGLTRLALGGVAEHVVAHARCPVLVVRPSLADVVPPKTEENASH